jgi:hypothetical protein
MRRSKQSGARLTKRVSKRTVTPKRKSKIRRKKLKYLCVHAQVTARKYIFDTPNEHGAMDDLTKVVPCYELHFAHVPPPLRNEVPRVIEAVFKFSTSDKELYDQYTVGQEYVELPK